MKRVFILLLSIVIFSIPLSAADFLDRKTVKIGEAVPDFQLQDAEGVTYRLSDYRGQVLMVHFWSATCPFVIRYDDRLKEIREDYKNREVVVLGIDSNSNETPEQIAKVAKKRKINYPILIDRKNEIADEFGAITTPHVFLIDREGKLIYEGAVDDQGWSEDNPVKTRYVRDAIDACLSGAPVQNSVTKSVGCTVKRAS